MSCNVGGSLALGLAIGWQLGLPTSADFEAMQCASRPSRRNIGDSLALGLAIGWRLDLLALVDCEGDCALLSTFDKY